MKLASYIAAVDDSMQRIDIFALYLRCDIAKSRFSHFPAPEILTVRRSGLPQVDDTGDQSSGSCIAASSNTEAAHGNMSYATDRRSASQHNVRWRFVINAFNCWATTAMVVAEHSRGPLHLTQFREAASTPQGFLSPPGMSSLRSAERGYCEQQNLRMQFPTQICML